MELVITISKTKTHRVKVKGKDNKIVEKDVPNSYLWLVLDSGAKILIQAVKDEDKKVLRSHAKVQR